jgi:hypothetical protein
VSVFKNVTSAQDLHLYQVGAIKGAPIDSIVDGGKENE